VRECVKTLPLFALLLALVAACSASGATTANQGFVSGAGTVNVIAPADRLAAPPVRGRSLTGAQVSLGREGGSVVVINVWGSWCPPCRSEAPALAAAARRLAPQGVRFVGIDVRDSLAQARAFTAKVGTPYPSIFDQRGETLLGFRKSLPPDAIPSTLVIDARGRVAARVLGPVNETTLVDLVHQVAGRR
jgi:thiol-disulfide isomerase/thioredoxin